MRYLHTAEIHNLTAPRAVVPFILDSVRIKSVLDVGCGTGTWLKAFEEIGISDYLGIDGDYVNKSSLEIPEDKFVAFDLRQPWDLKRRFDLVISLEVAEHLPEESSDLFVEALVRHSETIIFSAAIPGQGGQNHLNEQWPDYWQRKFLKHGFYFHDVIRPLIWDNNKVEWWYKQNIFLLNKEPSKANIHNWVHPDAFREKAKIINEIFQGKLGIRSSFLIFINAIVSKLRFIGT